MTTNVVIIAHSYHVAIGRWPWMINHLPTPPETGVRTHDRELFRFDRDVCCNVTTLSISPTNSTIQFVRTTKHVITNSCSLVHTNQPTPVCHTEKCVHELFDSHWYGRFECGLFPSAAAPLKPLNYCNAAHSEGGWGYITSHGHQLPQYLDVPNSRLSCKMMIHDFILPENRFAVCLHVHVVFDCGHLGPHWHLFGSPSGSFCWRKSKMNNMWGGGVTYAIVGVGLLFNFGKI